MQKFTDKELKREFESPRGQLKFVFTGLVFLVVTTAAFLTLVFDPFGWLDGPPAVHEAKKWLAICICFVWLPGLAGIWFMVISPLQTGIVTGGCKHRAPYVVLRSEEPARFRDHIVWNCILLIAGLVFATWMLVSFIRDLQKAKVVPPKRAPAMQSSTPAPSRPSAIPEPMNLDIFRLKDDALKESANLPAPEIIAADITVDLEAALEQFATIAEDLKR